MFAQPATHPNAFAAALAWIEGTLLGTVATTAAVIAVASVGFLMLTGRIDLRRAAQVVAGCFIIFGASAISSGIAGAISGSGPQPRAVQPPPLPAPAAAPPGPAYDPYAGAAVSH